MSSDLDIFRNDPDIQRMLAALDEPAPEPSTASITLPAWMLELDLKGARTPADIAARLRMFADAWEQIGRAGATLAHPVGEDGIVELRIHRWLGE